MPDLDDETKRLAALALRNAFWMDFSGMVNAYLSASDGLDIDYQEALLCELADVRSRGDSAEWSGGINIWTQRTNSGTTGHETIFDALQQEDAIEVHLNGRKIFEKRDGTWLVDWEDSACAATL